MKETVLGIQVNTESYDELLPKVFEQIEKQQKSLIVAINPEKIIKAKEDPALKTLLNNAEFQIPDGIGVILASKIQKGQITSRVTGVDMMMRLCEEAATASKAYLPLWGKARSCRSGGEEIDKSYIHRIQIAGTQDGYEKDNQKVIDKINEAKPDLLFVAMGSQNKKTGLMQTVISFIRQSIKE